MEHLNSLSGLDIGFIAAMAVSTILMAVVAFANSSYDPSPKWKVILQGGLLGLVLSAFCAGLGMWVWGQVGAIIAVGLESAAIWAIWMATGTVDALGCRPEVRLFPCKGCKPVACCKNAERNGSTCQQHGEKK
jgi:hypothetical protein